MAVNGALEHGPRKTQAERSAATRKQVTEAVIDCIVEEGIHNH